MIKKISSLIYDIVRIALLSLTCLLITACSNQKPDGPPKYDIRLSHIHNAVPHFEPKSRYGNPSYYQVNHHQFHVYKTAYGYDKTGIASWYGRKFQGHLTSTREPYNMYKMTAASRTLPLPTYVRVTNLRNHKTAIVRVNDRGPFNTHRIIDLSYAAAKKLDFVQQGIAPVRVTSIICRPTGKRRLPRHQHFLQVAAYQQLEQARKIRQSLRYTTRLPVVITYARSSKLYRVKIGPLPSRVNLFKLRLLLAKQYGISDPILRHS